MSQFVRLFTLALVAVALGGDSGTALPAELLAAGLPAELVEAASGLDLKGLKEIKAAAIAWAGDEPSRVKAQNIVDEITEAADASHDIFVGLRVFAASLQKALDADDEAALTKALGMREKFLKATGRYAKKVKETVAALNAHAKMALEHGDRPVSEEAAARIKEIEIEEAEKAEFRKYKKEQARGSEDDPDLDSEEL